MISALGTRDPRCDRKLEGRLYRFWSGCHVSDFLSIKIGLWKHNFSRRNCSCISMNLNPIGFVESPVVEGVDENWGKVSSKIIIHEIFAPGLKGLNEYSHIIVIFYMHKSSFEPEYHLVRRPQDNENYPITGIFAQRAKHRPNFIGVTSVELLSIEDRVLTVRGLDAINGSPVLDIKPYFPAYDRRDAITPKWVNKIMKKYF